MLILLYAPCLTGPWPVQGHIFKPDDDGSLTMDSRLEFHKYMDDRLTQAHDGKETTLPEAEVVFNHGDLSLDNIKVVPDGRIGPLDLAMAFWGPAYWDLIALIVSPYELYELEFVAPLQKAFKRRGLTVDPTT